MYLIPVLYQSLGIQLPKVVFPRVDSWSMGPVGFGPSQMHLIGSHGECWLVWLPGVADARGCGIVRTALQLPSSGYFGEFSGYAFPTE